MRDNKCGEIGGFCYSACTLVLAHVPKERLCFGQRAVLGFHLARFSLNGEPAIEASRAMFSWLSPNWWITALKAVQ